MRRAAVETLERRQLLSLTIDLRLAGSDAKLVSVSSVGQVVNLDIWATITGKNGDPTQDALQDVIGSFESNAAFSGAVAGDLTAINTFQFSANGAGPGAILDLNGDGNLDVGSNDGAFPWFDARSGSPQRSTDGVIAGGSLGFVVGHLQYTVTALHLGAETDLAYLIPPNYTVGAVWAEDGSGRSNTPVGGGVLLAGSPFRILDPALSAAPVAVSQTDYVKQNQSTNLNFLSESVLAASLDISTFQITSGVSHGSATILPDGSVTYTPANGFTGQDSFSYRVDDLTGQPSNIATVTIDVTPIAPPVAAQVSVNAVVNAIQKINVLASATHAAGTTLSLVSVIHQPAHGTAAVQSDGSILYSPGNKFIGTDSFRYRVTDSNREVSDIATVAITVVGTQPPYAAPGAVDTPINTPVDFNVIQNVKSFVGIPIDPTSAKLVIFPRHGTAIVEPDHTILYTPAPGFVGTDAIGYVATDINGINSNESVFYINVTPPPPPLAQPDNWGTFAGTPVVITVLTNDSAKTPGATLVSSSVVVVSSPVSGTAVTQADGTVIFTPGPGFLGRDGFTYTVKDSNGSVSNPASVTIDVFPHIAPTVADDSAKVISGQSVAIPVLANDVASAGASLNPAAVVISISPLHGTATVQVDGSIIYSPTADFTGTDTFKYTVADNFGIVSSPASVNITVSKFLTGQIIGTHGSYKNLGNTIANVFDQHLSTYFDGASPNGNFVGLDLGSPFSITQISYAPRPGWANRMGKGIFQGSNSADFTHAIPLFTISSIPGYGALTTVPITNIGAFRYVRYLSANTSYGNVAELQFQGIAAPAAVLPLPGNVIGTSGSYKNSGNTIAKVFDGDLSSFFDAPTANGNWAGLDLGAAHSIAQISYAPRAGWESRMIGGIFQASNTADFSSGVVNLYAITTAPWANTLTSVAINVTGAFRYVRYLSPAGGFGNVAEVEFF